MLRIGEHLDLSTVLQEVVDSARLLTDAKHSAFVTMDDSGEPLSAFTSGLTLEERRKYIELPRARDFFKYVMAIREPVRVDDFVAFLMAAGFDDLPTLTNTFLGTQIRYRDKQVGYIFIGNKAGNLQFTSEDEEAIAMFAALATMAIANAERYENERRAKAQLEVLVNTSPVGILVVDAKTGDFLLSNREAKRITTSMSLSRLNLYQLYETVSFRRSDGRDIPCSDLPLVRALGGEAVPAEEVVICLPGGQETTTLVSSTPIHSDDGRVELVVSVVQDITPLEELQKLRAKFLATVGNELRTPLAAIKGAATTALNTSPTPGEAETRQFFEIVDQQAEHMRGLINDLVDLTRVETGTLSVSLEKASVTTLVEQAKRNFLGSGHRNIVEVDIQPDLPPIRADSQRFLQVLGNLLANASNQSGEWSTITVTAYQDDAHVAITVSDEGRGLSSEELLKVFRKFTMIQGASGGPGEGLGLAICKGAVEAHGGRIWAESDGPGLGTKFTFTIPSEDGGARYRVPGSAQMPTSSGGGAMGGPRILAVDNDSQILWYLRNILQEAGYSLTATSNPNEVRRQIIEDDPHLILLDVMMPEIDGFKLMQTIARISDAPVIILSAHSEEENVTRGLEAGASDYIVKPFSPSELVARIRVALRKTSVSRRKETPETYALGDLQIDYSDHSVTLAGRPVALTPIHR